MGVGHQRPDCGCTGLLIFKAHLPAWYLTTPLSRHLASLNHSKYYDYLLGLDSQLFADVVVKFRSLLIQKDGCR